MDPTANLHEQIEIALAITDGDHVDSGDAVRLAELVIALNDWIVKGGALPSPWRAK